MKALYFAGALCLPLSFLAHAGDIRDQLNVQTGKAELVVIGMQPQDVANQIKDALSQFAIPANLSFRPLPSEIPTRPDEPIARQVYIQGAPAIEYQCRTAYAELTKRPPPVRNAFYFNAEYLQACLYPFQKGMKVHLVFTVVRKTESLTGGLFGGITKAIRGSDGERITEQLNENINAIKKNIPNLLVERLEAPGMPLLEPDKAAVAGLIPPKPSTPTPPVAAASGQAAIPIAPLAAAPQQAKIEARKNLNGMGMTYHSQEQFVAAIRRKDDMAVQLFLDGEGIDVSTKDKNGKTPFDIAREIGAVNITKIISEKVSKPVNVPAPSPVSQITTAPLAAPAATPPSDRKVTDPDTAMLSPEELAELNKAIDGMNISPEQKETARANAIKQIAAIKAFANRVDPNTGRLK